MLKVSRAEFSILLLVFTLFLTIVALFNQSNRAADDVIQRAYSNAEDLVGFVVVAERHYIDSVSGIPIGELTAHPEQDPAKTWMPFTYATRYTQSYSASNPGVSFRIYSRDPFVDHRDRVLDDFANDALDAVLSGEASSFRAVEPLGAGKRRVRYAAAFKMEEDCVSCHNRPEWGLKNQNWQVGDVRGAWEASLIVEPTNLHTRIEFYGLSFFVTLACIFAAFFVLPAVRREVKQRSFFHDRSVSMEEKAKQQTQEANTDSLTQIANRRFFDTVFQETVDLYAGKGGNLAAVMFDIDHFKRVNDTYGHDVGDRVIMAFAEVLRENCRLDDKVARVGGEEFALLIPDINAKEVLTICRRIKHEFATCRFDGHGKQFSVTVSVGVAYLRPNEGFRAVWKRADTLLYHAKETGRDRICDTFGQPQCGQKNGP